MAASPSYVNASASTPLITQDNNVGNTGKSMAAYLQGEPVLSGGIAAMHILMQLLTESANSKYQEILKKSEISRELQQHVNKVSSAIASIDGVKGDGVLEKNTVEAMKEARIFVNGGKEQQSITEYLTGKEPNAAGKYSLTREQLTAIQSALESTTRRASDMATNSQLIIQQITQSYNVAVSMINSLQGMIHKDNEAIANGMR